MEKTDKPIKKHKRKIKKTFKCTLCERIVVNPKFIKTRKNYSHGRKSKPDITRTHREDGGCLVEIKKKGRFR